MSETLTLTERQIHRRPDVSGLMTRQDISWKAKALAATILLHQSDFQDPTYRDKVTKLANMGREGGASVVSGLSELETLGILRKTKCRNEDGGRTYIQGDSWVIVLQ